MCVCVSFKLTNSLPNFIEPALKAAAFESSSTLYLLVSYIHEGQHGRQAKLFSCKEINERYSGHWNVVL